MEILGGKTVPEKKCSKYFHHTREYVVRLEFSGDYGNVINGKNASTNRMKFSHKML